MQRAWDRSIYEWVGHASVVVFSTPVLSEMVCKHLPLITLVMILPQVSKGLWTAFPLGRRVKYIERALRKRLLCNGVEPITATVIVDSLREFDASITGGFFLQMLLSPVDRPLDELWSGSRDLDIIPTGHLPREMSVDMCPEWCTHHQHNAFTGAFAYCTRCRVHTGLIPYQASPLASFLEAFLCPLFTNGCAVSPKKYVNVESTRGHISVDSRKRAVYPGLVELDFLTGRRVVDCRLGPPRGGTIDCNAHNIVGLFDIEACRAYCTFGQEPKIWIESPLSILRRSTLYSKTITDERLARYKGRGFDMMEESKIPMIPRDVLQFFAQRPDLVRAHLSEKKRKAESDPVPPSNAPKRGLTAVQKRPAEADDFF